MKANVLPRALALTVLFLGPVDSVCASAAYPLITVSSSGYPSPDDRWDVTKTRGKTRVVEFTTDEGTLDAVDISPDGQWVVFDLLGHVYRVAAEGGRAQCLTQDSGAALNYQPRYSPDGRSIAFVSDRAGGQDNLWIMDADGAHPRAVFLDRGSRIRQPAWMPDGRSIVAERVLPTVGSWEFHRTTLAEIPLDDRPPRELLSSRDWQYYWPAPSPDGRYLYFYRSTMMRPGDGVTESQQLQRLEIASGRLEDVTAPKETPVSFGPDLVDFAPEISPDGRWLAFGRRVPGGSLVIRGHPYNVRTALWLRDLQSGAERILMDPIESDATQGNAVRHMKVIPGYRWAKDSQSLIVPQGGQIRRVWLTSRKVETISFSAVVHREISEAVRSHVRISDGPLDVKFIRWPTSLPDGTRLVFEAVGRLWVMALPNGKAQPLLSEHTHGFEVMPTWSPDGSAIAYLTWADQERGAVWTMPAQGGRPQKLTREPGEYINPIWARDSRSVLVTRGDGATARGEGWNGIQRWDLVRLTPEGTQRIGPVDGAIRCSVGANGVFCPQLKADEDTLAPSRDGSFERLQWLMQPIAEGSRTPGMPPFVIEGTGPAPAEGGDWMASAAVSPNADWIAVVDRFNVYLAPLPRDAGAETHIRINGVGVRRLSTQGGLYPSWRNATTVQFVSGNRYYAYHTDTGILETTVVELHIPRPIPSGTIALTGARIVTLDQRKVIEQGAVLVRGGRISCVGACDLSHADRTIDISGETIIPGLVDMHAHHLKEVGGMVPQHRHTSARYLAHGVTTVLDPATWTDPAFPIAELIEAGELVGPRTYSVGNFMEGFGGTSDVRSDRDAEDHVARLVAWGAVSIKDYVQPSRIERQMLAQAARHLGVTITAEGEDLFRDLALVVDGHPGWEHNLPYTPLYKDATQFFGRAGAVYSATLNVSSPALRGQEYHEVRSNLLDDPKQQRFVPWYELIHSKYYMMRPLADYAFPILAEGVADIVHSGGRAAVGGHGEWQGLDTHWDLWSEAMALTPMEALEDATWKGASFIGLDSDLGSITAGKAADLVVLDGNPLEDIRNTRRIRYVMKAGHLYDGNTLDEIWPQSRPYGFRPWAVGGAALPVH